MAAKTVQQYTYSPEKVCKHVVKYAAVSSDAPLDNFYVSKEWLAANSKTDSDLTLTLR